MHFPHVLKKNQKGVAMLMAMVTITVLGILAAQLVYETEVYHRIVFNNVDKLRARYLAKSALRLSLLQIKGVEKARAKAKSLGDAVQIPESTFDMIWSTPIILPPPIPSDSDDLEKKALEEFNSKLDLGGKLSTTIIGESQKVNLNELVWMNFQSKQQNKNNRNSSGDAQPVEDLASESRGNPQQSSQSLQQKLEVKKKAVAELVDRLLNNRRQSDEKFEEKYPYLKGETLINNLLAWMDPNTKDDGDNRPKQEHYQSLIPPIAIKEAPLFALSELFMVKGFDDEIVRLFSENFGVSVSEGININSMGTQLLRALIPNISDRDVEAIENRRQEKPFSEAEDFWKFLNSLGDYSQTQKELTESGFVMTNKETVYRVVAEGSSGQSTRLWVAQVGALPPLMPERKNAQGAPSFFGGDQVNPDEMPDISTAELPTPGQSKEPGQTNPADQKTADTQAPNILYLKAD